MLLSIFLVFNRFTNTLETEVQLYLIFPDLRNINRVNKPKRENVCLVRAC